MIAQQIKEIRFTSRACRQLIENFFAKLKQYRFKALELSPTYEKAQAYLDFCLQKPSLSSVAQQASPRLLRASNSNQKNESKSSIRNPKQLYISHLLQFLEEPQIQNNKPLNKLFEDQVEELVYQKAEELTPKQQESYLWAQKLFVDHKVSSFVAQKLQKIYVVTSPISPPSLPTRSLEIEDSAISLSILKPLSLSPQMRPQEHYLKSIDLNPTDANAYNNLGATLPRDGTIVLLNGKQMSKQELLLKAIDLNPADATAYTKLGAILPQDGTIVLLNGKQMSQQALYLKAIDLNPSYANAYSSL